MLFDDSDITKIYGKKFEDIDKVIDGSKSLRRKVVVWISQISRGIKEILSYCHKGIKEWQKIEKRYKYKQLELKL